MNNFYDPQGRLDSAPYSDLGQNERKFNLFGDGRPPFHKLKPFLLMLTFFIFSGFLLPQISYAQLVVDQVLDCDGTAAAITDDLAGAGASVFDEYSCNNGGAPNSLISGENVYEFTLDASYDVTITLANNFCCTAGHIITDLNDPNSCVDLTAVSTDFTTAGGFINPIDGSAVVAGFTNAITGTATLPAGTYYIVIDATSTNPADDLTYSLDVDIDACNCPANNPQATIITSSPPFPFMVVCGGEESRQRASSPAADPPVVENYDWTVTGGITPGFLGQFANDGTRRNVTAVWENLTDDIITQMVDLTITYANGCSSTAPTMNVVVLPEPQLGNENKTVCSGQTLEVNDPPTAQLFIAPSFSTIRANIQAIIPGNNDDATLDFLITAVTPESGDLTRVSPATYTLNTPVSGDAILMDAWDNATTAPLTVTYSVIPRITYMVKGETHTCVGEQEDIVYTINPAPILMNANTAICSNEPTGIILASPGGSLDIDSYEITGLDLDGAVQTEGGPIVVGTTFNNADYLADVAFENTDTEVDIVQITIVPTAANGCPGEPATITINISPEPVLLDVDETICSNEATGILLTSPANNIGVDNYEITSLDLDGAVQTAGGSIAVGTTFSNADYLADVAFENVGTQTNMVAITIVPTSAGGCTGEFATININVLPEPVFFDIDTLICSNEFTGIVLASSANNIGATSYEITDLDLGNAVQIAGGPIAVGTTFTEADYFANVAFEYLGEGINTVQITVVPTSVDGCDGDSFVINVDVEFCPIGCSDNVFVTLDDDCAFPLAVNNLATGKDLPPGQRIGYTVVVNDGNFAGDRNIVNGMGRFEYAIFNRQEEMVCWGHVTAEDKTPPTIEAPEDVAVECWLIDEVLNQASTVDGGLSVTLPNSDGHLGSPVITDACEGNITNYTFSDAIEYINCSDETVIKNGVVVGVLYARITRRFVTRDSKGNTAEDTQIISFFQPPLTEFSFVADADKGFAFVDGQWVQTVNDCGADSSNPPAATYPEYTDCFENTVDLGDNLCNYSSTVKGRLFDNVCGDGYKMERTIELLDWCDSRADFPPFTYLIKVGDFAAPEFDGCADGLDATTYSIADVSTIIDALNADSDDFDVPAPGEACAMISTGPMDCTAAINTSLSALKSRFGSDIIEDACGDDLTISVEILSYLPVYAGKIQIGDPEWQSGGYVMQGSMATGIPVGRHALVISASDGCYNSALGILFFEVMDLVKPVMKCDDELRVTLVEGDEKLGIQGYALVTYEDVDEGSWDNCELVDLHVRRDITNAEARVDWEAKNGDLDDDADYTPWADIVEFFCADVDEPVTVELRGTDAKGNQSVCWLDIDVENGLNFSASISGGGKITCEEVITMDNVMDYVNVSTFGMQCVGAEVGVRIEADLDQCGEGYYRVYLDVEGGDADSKNSNNIDPDPVIIEVVGLHDYWIKFPADVELTCDDLEEYEGVEVSPLEDNACDLLAVYTDTPERFVASGGACYKLFQTYKVINWCEYDGESLPVIVSRDWDAHNGHDGCFVNNDNDQTDPGEYNLNPQEPDGDGQPGDEDIYVIVHNKEHAEGFGIVYYDNNSDPTDNSTANLFGDNSTNPNTSADDYEGYWWAVTKQDDCRGTGSSVWYDDEGNFGINDSDTGGPFDIDGNDAHDDNDNRYGSHGYWQYTQHIIVYDETAPTVTVTAEVDCSQNNELCTGGAELTIVVEDDCTPVENIIIQIVVGDLVIDRVEATSNGDGTATAVWPVDELGLGDYIYKVRVNDGCGNTTDEQIEFTIEDCKAPAPICHDGLQVELMPTEDGDGMAAVWASDFVASDIGDCTGQGPEEVTLDGTSSNTAPKIATEAYSIYRDAGFTDTTYVSPATDETVRGLIVTCDDLSTNGGMVMVRVYAEDMAGNADYCLTFVQVQNNNGACAIAAPGQIAGVITTENNANIEGAEVQLSGASSMMYMTDANGNFVFDGLAIGGDYTITPQMDVNYLNGVSTFDLVLISKHILGVQQLDSPYKLIAADVNNSKSVTTLDLIQLRKLILNIDTEFSNNTSWRFVDAAHTFASPSNPWSTTFPEFRNVNNLTENAATGQFVGIKVGDVNNSASVEARSATGTLAINAAERAMVAGNEYTVTFDADMQDIEGYQFTMNVANAEIVDLVYGAAKAENFGVFSKEGVITTSFNGEATGELFSLVIRATADVNLSEALTVNSRYTVAEAYDANGEQLNVALNFTGATAEEAAFSLTQNTPNPFQGETVIGFNLPSAGEATLTIQDVAGRTVKMIEGDFTKGYNQVTLNSSDLPSAGVFFYTLTAGELSATKKMILVDAVNR